MVEATRYPPLGRRSVQSTFSATRYRSYPVRELLAEVERKTIVSCMVETAEGAENIEAIAAVEGVDMIHIGCTDLVADWGMPNAFDDPRAQRLRSQRRFPSAGSTASSSGWAATAISTASPAMSRKGLNLYTTQTDITFLMQAASKTTSALREKVAALA